MKMLIYISIQRSRNSAFKDQEIQHFFQAQISLDRMLYFLLINVKMPTIVGILTFMSRDYSCSAELSMKKYYNLGSWPVFTATFSQFLHVTASCL